MAVIGAATALFAATIGLAQNDIKKVLAYSTVSQLGYMFLAAGVGAYTAAIFHLATHAFFKALLFLGSGSVIHAMGGEQDMTKMGGLKKHLPVTYRTFLDRDVGDLRHPAARGLLQQGRDPGRRLRRGSRSTSSSGAIGLLTAGLTACYMFRAVYLTFEGEFRGTHEQEHHLHESPRVMTLPLWCWPSAPSSSGWIGIPKAVWDDVRRCRPQLPSPLPGAGDRGDPGSRRRTRDVARHRVAPDRASRWRSPSPASASPAR